MGVSRKFAALLLGMALITPVAKASPQDPANVAELVTAVQATYAGATSIRADFVQVSKSAATGVEEKQHGRLSAERPRKLRVETGPVGQPVQQTLVSDGKTLWIYTAKDKQVMEMPEMGESNAGVGILLEDLGKLGELFDVTLEPQTPPKASYTVQLVPKKAGNIKSARLTLSKQKYAVQNLVLVTQFDDVVTMDFSMVKMNQDIPDSEFTFVVPAGVNVVKTGAM